MKPKRAPGPHERLFAEYVLALEGAVAAARKSFDGSTLRPPLQKGAPPLAADPRVLAVIRRFFFACESLNRESGTGSHQAPHVFVLERLSPRHDELQRLLLELTYLPIGVNEIDEWV